MSTILIVEDDLDIQRMLSYALRRFGSTIHTVDDGNQAMEYLKSSVPNLIILDWNLPYTSGEDILRYIRSHPELGEVRVIVMTVFDPLELKDAKEQAEFVFQKPYILNEFRAAVAELLR